MNQPNSIEPSPPCPTPSQWTAYHRGEVEEAPAAILEEHLQHCNACERALAQIEGESASWRDYLAKSLSGSFVELHDPPSDCGSSESTSSGMRQILDHLRRQSPQGIAKDDGGNASDQPQKIGPYLLLEQLGVGGMGVVYLARDTRLHRPVALKLPRIAASDDADLYARFMRESRAAARLRHPNICPVHDIGEYEGRPYMAMEYVEGITLQAWLNLEERSFVEIAQVMSQLAGALQFAHEKGVVHRDLKPANVMVDLRSSTPIVMDFGLARTASDMNSLMTRTGLPMGTPAYMAPEQAAGDWANVGPAADQYSLGVILFRLLTGETPFRGNPDVLLDQVRNQDAPSARTLNANVPKDLETITARCLEKDAARRYPGCGALAADLQRFIRNEPVKARPLSPFMRAVKWTRRHPARAALVGLSATAAVAFVTLGAVLWYNQMLHAASVRELNAMQQKLATSRESLSSLIHQTEELEQNISQERNRLAELRDASQLAAAAMTEQRDRGLFAMHLQRVAAIWQSDPLLGKQLLEDEAFCPADRRDFAWRYWNRLCNRHLATLDIDSDVSVSPDGKLFGMVSDGQVVLVSTSTGGIFRRFDLPVDPFGKKKESLQPAPPAFSADGAQLAVATLDGVVLLDSSTGKLLKTLDTDFCVSWLEFSPDGSHLAAAMGRLGAKGGGVAVWESANWKLLYSKTTGDSFLRHLAWAPDARRFASIGFTDNRIAIWSIESEEPLQWFPNTPGWGTRLAFAPDGQLLAATTSEGMIYLHNLISGESTKTNAFEAGLYGVAFAPTGKRLITGSDNRNLSVWDAAKAEKLYSLTSPSTGRVSQVGFLAGGDRMFSVAPLNLWKADPIPVFEQLTDRTIYLLQQTEDGEHLLLSGPPKSALTLVKASDFSPVRDFRTGESHLTAISASRETNYVAGGTFAGEIILWDYESGKRLRTIERPTKPDSGKPQPSVVGLAFLSQGRIVSASRELHEGGTTRLGDARVWDLATGAELAVLDGHPFGVQSVASSPDGGYILTGDAGTNRACRIHVWDANTYQEVARVETGLIGINCLRFAPSGQLLASAGERSIKLWSWNNGELKLLRELRGHTAAVIDFQFADQGDFIISLDTDGGLKIWDTLTGLERSTLPAEPAIAAHINPLMNVIYHAPTDRVIAAGNGNSVYTWPAE